MNKRETENLSTIIEEQLEPVSELKNNSQGFRFENRFHKPPEIWRLILYSRRQIYYNHYKLEQVV